MLLINVIKNGFRRTGSDHNASKRRPRESDCTEIRVRSNLDGCEKLRFGLAEPQPVDDR